MRDFYQKYYNSVRGFVSKRIGDEGTLDELTDDILLAAYKSLPSFNQKCSEFSFICAIAKHKIVDYYRKKKLKTILFSTNPMFEEIADQAIGPERDVLKNELIEEIEATLREVKGEYGNLLRLKYVEGWKTSAIATLTKMSIKAVESRLVRAKKQFQRLWNYDQKKAKESIEVRDTDRS
jgi:RNA polymerase sigma-70 factor (ECF subfamily)